MLVTFAWLLPTRHGHAERTLSTLAMLFVIVLTAPAQALIDYHQHLLMPTDKSPQAFVASDLVKLLNGKH